MPSDGSADRPDVSDVLTLDTTELGPLTRPVLVVGLTGWFDVAGAATAALGHLVKGAITVGEIDPDPFYDFTQERPTVELVDGETRRISWPSNAFRVVRTGGARDLVVLSGVEPHLAWPVYVGCIRAVVDDLGCGAVVTVGATADAVPHTRLPPVVGSTADADLAGRLALSAPTYQGITGLIGVLHVELERVGIPTISLRVGVPHYLTHIEHPLAVTALIRHLAHVLGVPLTVDLSADVDRMAVQHAELVDSDEQMGAYVRMLEIEYDRRAEATLRTADDIAERFEEFLRDQRPGEPDDPAGAPPS
ncbi:MAG: PAC2 family protein [Ilumatobacteraceae bacterium]